MSSFSEKELEKQLKIYMPERDPDPDFVQNLETILGKKARRMATQRKWSRHAKIIGVSTAVVSLVIWGASPDGQPWVKNMIISNVKFNQTTQDIQRVTASFSNREPNGENFMNAATAEDSGLEYKTIQEKMLNAIDNYKNIKGKFHIINKEIELDNIIEFEVSQGNEPGSNVIVKGKDGKILTEYRSGGSSILFMNHVERKYKREAVSNTSDIPEGPRYFIDDKGQQNWITRPDPAWAYSAHDVIFPQNYAFWLTDRKNYKIVDHEEYLGRNATVIEGKNEPYSAKLFEDSYFRMWVDTETGIILKLITTDENMQISNSIEVLSLAIDQGVDRSKFSTNVPSG